MMKQISDMLFPLSEEQYAALTRRIVSNIPPETVIGVRVPALRKMAKEIAKNEELCREFLNDLPHRYLEENELHFFIIAAIKDYDRCLAETERFLPYVDNWMVCDGCCPKAFAKHREELLPVLYRWMDSGLTYTVRYGIKILMNLYLDDAFEESMPLRVAQVRADEYYVSMMAAWYMATGLAKQWDAVFPVIEGHKLDTATHNRAIRKALESYRITEEQKTVLRELRTGRQSRRENSV